MATTTITEIYNLDPTNAKQPDVSVAVTVPVGSNGIAVMDAAAVQDRRFYYTSLNGSKYGAQIIGIGNLMVAGNYYFELLVGPNVFQLQPSRVGISSYIPNPDSVIKWVLKPYVSGQCNQL